MRIWSMIMTISVWNQVFPRKKKSAWLRKAKMGFWPFLTYNTASSKWIRTATTFTLVVQNSSFLCHAEYCSIEKKEVESLNHIRCRSGLSSVSRLWSSYTQKREDVGNQFLFPFLNRRTKMKKIAVYLYLFVIVFLKRYLSCGFIGSNY